jgi:hypothetical protein
MFKYFINRQANDENATMNDKIKKLMTQSEWLNKFLVNKDVNFKQSDQSSSNTQNEQISNEELGKVSILIFLID